MMLDQPVLTLRHHRLEANTITSPSDDRGEKSDPRKFDFIDYNDIIAYIMGWRWKNWPA